MPPSKVAFFKNEQGKKMQRLYTVKFFLPEDHSSSYGRQHQTEMQYNVLSDSSIDAFNKCEKFCIRDSCKEKEELSNFHVSISSFKIEPESKITPLNNNPHLNFRFKMYPDIDNSKASYKVFYFETKEELTASIKTSLDLLLFIQDNMKIMKELSNMFISEQKINDDWEKILYLD
jgi:hypothetical protein